MKILFNASQCGLGNNGGTKTIIKSAETLRKLGHTVAIWANVNNYTWHGYMCSYFSSVSNGDKPQVPIWPELPKNTFDTIINVSIWDVESTLKSPIKNKVWWMRGWETWVKGEQYLIDQIHRFVNRGGKIIVNSGWLVEKLKSMGVGSKLCWAGLDLSFWRYIPVKGGSIGGFVRKNHNFTTFGGLWHPKHKTKNYHIFEQLQEHFGDNTYYKFKTLKNDLNNDQLLEFYNECDIWLALSELEGFHQVPAEAALCGCSIVYNNIDSGGCHDYCTPETATPFTSFEGLVEAIENLKFGKVDKMKWLLHEKIGDRENNMRKLVEVLSV